MRLTSKQRNQRRRAPRIEISQAEITADLLYPANARTSRPTPAEARRASGR
ncbi:MAG TPA: hypothetical protein VHA54_03690 [Solirubrobacterales bacterium]|nr:hypothetical protein [Solirubrobacterales bacterium]